MNSTLRKVASTIGSIIVVVGIIAIKGCNRVGNKETLKTEEKQYYQLDELNNALDCNVIHHELLEFMRKSSPTIEKGGSVTVPLMFSTRNCGRSIDYRGKIPELHSASETYLRNFQEVTRSLDSNGDHKMSPEEFDAAVDNFNALADKGQDLFHIYGEVEEKWYKARLDTIGHDHARRHVHWVYTLALDINLITRSLRKDDVDVPVVEKAIASLKQNLADMKDDMEGSDWNQQDKIEQWAQGIPDFLQAAQTRLDFIKNKAATATEDEKEASQADFRDAEIGDQPESFEDTFVVPESTPSHHHS